MRLRIVALSLFAIAAIAAIALWRDPFLLVRGEFARQRVVAGLSRATVEAAGHRWVYAQREADDADAPTIVMIHGFTGSKENWYPLARELGGRYRLLIPDLPGWGESERRPGAAYGFPEQAAHVDAFIRALSPQPGRSGITSRYCPRSCAASGYQFSLLPVKPWIITTVGAPGWSASRTA